MFSCKMQQKYHWLKLRPEIYERIGITHDSISVSHKHTHTHTPQLTHQEIRRLCLQNLLESELSSPPAVLPYSTATVRTDYCDGL